MNLVNKYRQCTLRPMLVRRSSDWDWPHRKTMARAKGDDRSGVGKECVHWLKRSISFLSNRSKSHQAWRSFSRQKHCDCHALLLFINKNGGCASVRWETGNSAFLSLGAPGPCNGTKPIASPQYLLMDKSKKKMQNKDELGLLRLDAFRWEV